MANPNLDKSVLKLDMSTDDVVDVGGALTPPVLTPESEFEKLLQEETARFNLPLALRKSPRATAGMKYTLIHDEENESQDVVFSKPAVKNVKVKEIKTSSKIKRKLELGSSAHPGKMKHKDKHKDKHRHKHKESESVEDYVPPSSKKRKIGALRDQDSRNDFYCWYCHKEGSVICCELCPRVYHTRCLKYKSEPEGDWVCPVCQKVLESECVDTQSKAMSRLSVSQLSRLLNYALQRMKHQGTDSFQKPVSLDIFPDYAAFVFNPMDLGTLEENIQKNIYGSTYAFLEETKWILHNSIIFNGSHHKVTSRAKSIVKICDYEMNEIEICPSCYLSSCLKRAHWFCEPCDPPHPIVWAKLQGFPHWQAKVLRESEGQVDVRFFGQHDRAWIPVQNCYIISKEPPIVSKKHSSRLSNASKELKIYVENVKAKFGTFEYAPQRTPYKLGTCFAGSVNKSPARKKSPARAIKPLSGKPASFMNGIREAEALEDKSEVKDTSELTVDLADNSVGDNDQSKTRCLSESASVDEESIDSMSQDSSTWSVGSGQSLEKQDKGTVAMERPVADCTAPTSRMGGMKVVVKKLNSKTSKDGVPELTPKTAEFTRKRFLEEEESPSKKAAPAGVFEISNESLDIDEDREKKSPSVQLLGKVHVSPKGLNRSLDADKDKTQGVESGDDKSGIQKRLFPSPKKHAEIETDVKRLGESQEQDGNDKTDASGNAAAEGIKNSDKAGSSHEQMAVEKSKTLVSPVKLKVDLKGQSAISVDGDSESSSVSTSGSLQSILTTKLPNPLDLDEAEIMSKTAESEMPSTSKGTPRNSDKFHINLSRTIETMKASLGMESMETNENSESESESESVSANEIEQDSDSSDAHSEGSSMEVDTKNDGEEEKRVKQEATKDNVPKTTDVNMDANSADEMQLMKGDDKVKDQSSEVASDCGLSLNLNSADDQSESELVIDMDRVEGGESSNVLKEQPDQEMSNKVPSAQNELSDNEEKSLGNENESKNRMDDCSTESAVQENISFTEVKCEGIERTTGETSTDASNEPTNPEMKSRLSGNDQNVVKKDDATPSIVLSPTSILASQKLAEIVQQKEMEERKMLTKQKVVEEQCQKPETEEKMDVANVESVAKDADKDTNGEKLKEGKEEDYPLEEEDPLKAWGTADELLDKYSNQVSKCVRESLTTVRRDLIDSITSVDIKTQIEQLQAQVTRLTWEKEQQKRELQHIMDLRIAEMRESLNADLKSCEASTKKEAQKEKEDAVREAKKKQWCAQCEQEAYFYCCWNTSYCSYLCQQRHWSTHQNLCQQPNTQNGAQTSSQPPTTVPGTLTMSTVTSSAPSTSAGNATTTSTSDRLHIVSTQASQNPSIQVVQTAPVTAAQSTSNVTPQSVQTLIRYVQAPRLPLQSGTLQTQPAQQIIRLPMNQVGGQLVRTLPATIRQVGGQQQLVVSSQALQSLQAKKSVPNLYNV